MSTTAVELQGLSQAGKPYMRLVRVRWDSKYFRSGLRTTPTPLLVPMLGSLYIQWGQDPLLLTQLLLYGDSLTPSIKSRSEGNSFLMYKPGMEWFPIALHLTQETPGLQIKMSHVMDYCTPCGGRQNWQFSGTCSFPSLTSTTTLGFELRGRKG